jgi:hypothetical protein
MSGPSGCSLKIDCHCRDLPLGVSLATLGPRSWRCPPGSAPFHQLEGGPAAALTSNDPSMGRAWRRGGAGRERYATGTPFRTGGVGVACAEALSAGLHSSFSNVGIERAFPRTMPARCCPECCPNLAGDDQRVRSLPPNPLILLAPRAGLEPATKRLIVSCSKSAMPHGDIAPSTRGWPKPKRGHLICEARSRSPLTLPPYRVIRMLGRCRARHTAGTPCSSTPFPEGLSVQPSHI